MLIQFFNFRAESNQIRPKQSPRAACRSRPRRRLSKKIKCTNENLYIDETNITKEEHWTTVFNNDKQGKQNW